MRGGYRVRMVPAVDAADKETCRPDFAVALYPGHLAVPETDFALNPDIQVTSRTPPTFLPRTRHARLALLDRDDDHVGRFRARLRRVRHTAANERHVPARPARLRLALHAQHRV